MAWPPQRKNKRELHARALKDIVKANTFFTAAVFIGITGTVTPSPGIPPNCVPGGDINQSLFLFEVLSFSFYLLSSLVAQAMKLAISYLQETDPGGDIEYRKMEEGDDRSLPPTQPEVHFDSPVVMPAPWWMMGKEEEAPKSRIRWFRRAMMWSVVLSVLGGIFLLLAMINVIQLKLGLLSCGGAAAVGAVLALALLGFVGLFAYAAAVVSCLKAY